MTVRSDILQAIQTALLNIESIGQVIGPGDFSQEISGVLTGDEPRHVAEVAFGDDTVVDRPTSVIIKEFDVAVMVHLSSSYADSRSNTLQLEAELVYADIERLYGGYGPDDGTWGGLANMTEDDGGGGGLSYQEATSSIATVVYFKVQYQHVPGAM